MENFWTVQQAARKKGVSVHTLRYYEKAGLLEGVARDGNGYRQYSEADLQWVDFLLVLRGMGMSIREMKRYSDLRSQGSSTVTERRQLLEAHLDKVARQVEELRRNMGKIGRKIEIYKEMEREAQPSQ